MPVVDLQEARDLDQAVDQMLAAPDLEQALHRLRAVFVERLDFDPASGTIPLQAAGLPPAATRIAVRDGVHVVALALPDNRVPAESLRAALKEVGRTLGGDLLLVATDQARSQWHFVYPADRSARTVLRRMVVHRGQPRRTVVQELAGVYHQAFGGDLRAALERAYDVEAVTRSFFQEYRRIFEEVRGLVQGLPNDEERKLFCQTLFNRLMFLYFLQRKGWLTFRDDPDYLDALWQDARQQGDVNFYETRLCPLFFAALNNPRTTDFDHAHALWAPILGQVPFLNGGLFEQAPIDSRPGVVVPDEAIRLILRELFTRFNFTIMESTPYDVEVAVDPEMLGKVFEELVTGRHESGSYYTPRPIVAFMCRESLKHYLLTRVPGLSDEAVGALVEDHDVSRLTVQQARQVLDALEAIAVVDPACGSGAYLLGMLHELVELQTLLYSSSLIRDSRSLYELKLRVIERNLYGADVDRFAVNIAMLRLWLSLVIEYEGPGDPPALPNLGFKIVCGDSLSAPDPNPSLEPDMFRAFVHTRAAELSRRKAEFMRETGEAKRVIEQEIHRAEADISAMLSHAPAPPGSVDWRVRFAEVFDAQGGFDVVLANPPYVRQELIKDIKPQLKATYGELYSGTADLYVYFYYRAVQLLRAGGMLVFISSNKWLRSSYGANLRGLLAARTGVLHIVDFADLPVFESAIAYPMILVAQAGASAVATHFTQVPSLDPPYPDVRRVIEQGRDLPDDALNGRNWSLTTLGARSTLDRMQDASVALSEYVGGSIFNGVKSGLVEAFVVSGANRDLLVAADPESAELFKPTVDGVNLRRYCVNFRERYLIYIRWDTDIQRHPAILEHLTRYRLALESRDGVKNDGPCPWFALQRPRPESARLYQQTKILFPDIAKSPRFCLDDAGLYPGNTAYCIPSGDLFLLGVLNSRAVEAFYLERNARVRGGYLRFFRPYVERIPIPNAPIADRAAIAALVQDCLDARGQGPRIADWEAEINERVARLYGLDPSEANP